MSKSHQKIIVHIHPDIMGLPNIEVFKSEFESYKSLSFEYAEENSLPVSDFLPALSEADQKEFPPDHLLFGRDRLFTGGWSGYTHKPRVDRAAHDALYHVHIYKPEDKHCHWHDVEKGIEINQWYCRSDAALIYSYIDDLSGDFNFLMLEIVDPGAHAKYEQNGAIVYWRKKAEAYWVSLGKVR